MAWLHVSSFAGVGSDDEALNIDRHDNGVAAPRWIEGKPPSSCYAKPARFESDCGRLHQYEMCLPAIGMKAFRPMLDRAINAEG